MKKPIYWPLVLRGWTDEAMGSCDGVVENLKGKGHEADVIKCVSSVACVGLQRNFIDGPY